MKDRLDPARAEALAATLGLEARFAEGDPLPPFFHQIYFWEVAPPEALGRDGHPALGRAGLVPDLGLPRRMWGGGRLSFHAPLLAGVAAEKVSALERLDEKEGRTGKLALAVLRHEIRQQGTLKVTEWQDLIYREAARADEPGPLLRRAPEDEHAEPHVFGPVELFRYSALTFNGHRIHYDTPFTTGEEGYPGLLAHGPLLAQRLMLKAARELGPLAGFRFRATAPLIAGEAAALCRSGPTLWVRGEDGRLCMEASAETG